MTTDTTLFDRKRAWIKEAAKKWWCNKYFDCLFLPGERSAAYFSGLSFPEARIWRSAAVVDNQHFENRSFAIRNNTDESRSAFNLPDEYFLTVCRLSPEKNIPNLLEAYRRYTRLGGNWNLVIVGSGPEEQSLKRFIREQQISGVHLVPWTQYDELPAYYALASCFILPSISEPWGLVVNEAMACGLPVLVSRNCGCLPELCQRGINGYDFDPYDVDELASYMLRFSSGELDLEAMGQASRRIIANFTPETWAASLKDCIETTLAQKG